MSNIDKVAGIGKVAGVVALILGAGLAACETPTPYQPLKVYAANWEGLWGGFSDQKLDADRYRVTFTGNSFTSRQTVEAYLLYRAAELTVAQGFGVFEMAERHTDRDQEIYVNPDIYGAFIFQRTFWRPDWRFYGVRLDRWNGTGVNYEAGVRTGAEDLRVSTRFEASIDIVMRPGPRRPGDPRTFDARQVMANLADQIHRPS